MFLVDDHRVFAETLALAVSTQPDLYCTGVAHSVREARSVLRELAAEQAPDLAIIDLDLPDGSGLYLVAELAQRIPVVVLTAHPRFDVLRRATAAGAAGVLGKDQPLHEILATARTALAGAPVRSRDTDPAVHLTGREMDVLAGLGAGVTLPASLRIWASPSTRRATTSALCSPNSAHTANSKRSSPPIDSG
ncbi:hypothetical protein BJF90_22495 [Pseudonocardia sp. CNS-004]|nr:hypothetical protein BJF90_22495 [Pseudonocardia sp. CNS-004]